MTRHFGLLGVPSSAGAKTPGIDKAPAALRSAGIAAQLAASFPVTDHGDLPRFRQSPDPAHPKSPNAAGVASIAQQLAAQVYIMLAAGETPLILGGDCSITIGAVAGFVAHHPALTLLYMDGGVDLYSPETNDEPNIDSMGVAYMLGEAGSLSQLINVGPRSPLLTPQQVVYYAIEPSPSDNPEQIAMESYGIKHYPASAVRGRATAAAGEALAYVEALGQPFLLHFDVDVIDFIDFPIADVPQFNRGIKLTDAMESMTVFSASPLFAGLVITEINPDHMDETGDNLRRFVAELVAALQSA